MTFQYSLRFDSGERRGEVVPLTIVAASGGSFTIGRKPGNSLQVTDVSISGRHAELQIDQDGVSLRDLNSTNGTLVGGRKVRQTSLEPGDDFTLGAVEFTLLEGVEGASAAASAGGASEELSLEDPDELTLEDPDEVAPAVSMPRKMPKKAPAAKPAAAPKSPQRPKATPPPMEGIGETQLMPQEDGLEITAEDLARSAKSSKLGPILLVGLAAVGGGAWWWLGQRSGGDGGEGRAAAVTPPSAPAGNLLTAGYSFEDSEGWTSDTDVPAEFLPARSARRSGLRGIQADLAGGEVAQMESASVRVPAGSRALRVEGHVRADSSVEFRVGLRYATGSGEDALTTTVWSDPCATGEEFAEIQFAGTAPQGVASVQVLLRAECTDAPPEVDTSAEGDEDDENFADLKSVSVDDVALVPASDAPAAVVLDAFAVTPIGVQGAVKSLSVTSLDRLLISQLRVAKPSAGSGYSLSSQDLSLEADGGAVRLTPAAPGSLYVRGEEALVSGGIATLGESGYASHGSTFERSGVTGLILGEDARMVAIKFAEPADLVARASGGVVTFRVELDGGGPVVLKTSFMEERTRAQRLARRAKEERSSGDSGAALATWNELLTEVPYDTRLIGEAAAGQTELLGEGRAQLKELSAEVERARFFGLADLFREKIVRAEDLGRRFRGTDVEAQAIALRDVIRSELAALDSNKARHELQRLEAIQTVLRRQGAEDLARRVDEYKSAQASQGQGGAGAGSNETSEGGQ